MNLIIPARIVGLMRNSIAILVSIALIILFTPSHADAYSIFYLMVGVSFVSFLVVMIATKRELFAGILFAVAYSGVDTIRMRLDHSYYRYQDYGLNEFFVLGFLYIVSSLAGTAPVYLWRRWRSRLTKNKR